MNQAAIIEDTLERVTERLGDPRERIYRRLFELHPEFERLFVLDVDGGVRGSMLETSINCVLGVARNETETARFLIEAARMIHDGYGIRDEEVDSMFVAMRDVVREVIGADWTPDMERAWSDLLDELSRVGRASA